MIRFGELGLLVAPLAVYLLFRLFTSRWLPGPSRQTLAALLVGLVLAGASLVWTGLHERHPADSHYVPAQLEGGRVVPGHGA